MIPLPELVRLLGISHRLPDYRALRVVDGESVTEVDFLAEGIYAALPDIMATAIEGARARGEIRAALGLPASTPWAAVLARCRHLAACDPARTLDDEEDAPHSAGTSKFRPKLPRWAIYTEDGDLDGYVWATDADAAMVCAREIIGTSGDFTVAPDDEPTLSPHVGAED